MQTNKSILYTPTTFFTELSQDSHHILGHGPFALITPGPGSRQLRTVCIAQSLWNYLYQSIQHTLPWLFLPTKATMKALAHISPLVLLSLDQPGASPCGSLWQSCSFLLGTVSNKLSFQWQSSPDLLASPYLGDNKAYILHVIVISRWSSVVEHMYSRNEALDSTPSTSMFDKTKTFKVSTIYPISGVRLCPHANSFKTLKEASPLL